MSDEAAGQVPTSAAEEPADGLETLTGEVLPALISRLRSSRLGELEVHSGSWRIRLRRDPAATRPAPAATGIAAEEVAPVVALGSVATSSAVGYFSPAPSLVVGASVQAGDLLGSIDVLGIAQEVTAPANGIVARVLAEDGQAVEFGQALAEVDPLEIAPDAADGEAGEDA